MYLNYTTYSTPVASQPVIQAGNSILQTFYSRRATRPPAARSHVSVGTPWYGVLPTRSLAPLANSPTARYTYLCYESDPALLR